ncbi:MAG: threonine synthase [Bacteroidales bacterium]|nr:threonine synthase [Bacteroidales bacterium]
MLNYVSIKGGGDPVDLETAVINGFASDGGLYVPEHLPRISKSELEDWKRLGYKDLAFEILSLFMDRSTLSAEELKGLIDRAYGTFEAGEVIPIRKLPSRKDTYVMELFYGPTLSFKDIGLVFLVNLLNFFLERRGENLSVIVATTGDTGPATASFIAGLPALDAWVLYPRGKISEEQERQMTTLPQLNVHPVGVFNYPEGGDDLDAAIRKLFANQAFKEKVKLGSVNSINWGRIMVQIVHYVYGYLQVVDAVGEEINLSVPSGGFGNLCAGSLARNMGLPVKTLMVANNRNACLDRIFRKGIFSKEKIHETLSSAIDILVPVNFWRYLYFAIGKDPEKIRRWMEKFEEKGIVQFDLESYEAYQKGFLSVSVGDELTQKTIRETYETEGYLLDPHGALALAAADLLAEKAGDHKLICLATAHPAKFPDAIKKSLEAGALPAAAIHPSLERAKKLCQKGYSCEQEHLEEALLNAMESYWEQSRGANT